MISTTADLPESIRGERLSEVHLLDCMEGMKQFPDNHFDLAVVDPPYGIDADQKNSTSKKQSTKSASKSKNYGDQRWDSCTPDRYYFDELKRVSKRQIIWGANYFGMSGGMLYWHKNVTMPTYSSGELACLSWLTKMDFVEITWHGMIQHNMTDKETRIHPTQKPVALYDWIYKNYLPEGGKVIDTHLGSGSNRIAAHKAGNIDFTGYEIDQEYFEAHEARWKEYISQTKLFR